MADLKRFNTTQGPKAIGPYHTAVRANGLVFCSGITPIDPATGQLVEGGIEEQTMRVLESIRTIAAELGVSMTDAVKATVFLTDMGDFAKMNAIYKEAFAGGYPARSTVAVAGLPMGARVEVEVIFAE